jgi:hypothetical protein
VSPKPQTHKIIGLRNFSSQFDLIPSPTTSHRTKL